MAQIITNLTATTELEAINAMLTGIGEQPLPTGTDLATSTQSDVAMALGILRDISREVQSMGWKFNTEFGFELAPTTTYDWVDTAGVTTTLNIFTPPAHLSGFKVTEITEQIGWKAVDTEIRPSRKYQVSSTPVLVFYDRSGARDGFEASKYPYLYINPIWLFAFEQLPEVARRYIVTKAGRTFVQSSVGSDTLARFTEKNEAIALRNLKREQGAEDTYSFVGNVGKWSARGRRPSAPVGFVDPRRNRNST